MAKSGIGGPGLGLGLGLTHAKLRQRRAAKGGVEYAVFTEVDVHTRIEMRAVDPETRRALSETFLALVRETGKTFRIELLTGDERPVTERDHGKADCVVVFPEAPEDTPLGPPHAYAMVFGSVVPLQAGIACAPSWGGSAVVHDPITAQPVAEVYAAGVRPDGVRTPAYIRVLVTITAESFPEQAEVLRAILRASLPLAFPGDVIAGAAGAGAPDEGAELAAAPVVAIPLPTVPMDAAADTGNQVRWRSERAAFRNAHGIEATFGFEQLLARVEVTAAATGTAVEAGAAVVRQRSAAFEDVERTFGAAASAAAEARERLALEFDRLTCMSKIERVEIGERQLVVTTGPLTIEDEGTTYDIGGWVIAIPRGSIEGIRIRSRSGQVGPSGWPHPHVDASGLICWGNVKHELERALQASEYDVAVQYLIALLETGRGRQSDWEFHRRVLREIGRPIPRRPAPTPHVRDVGPLGAANEGDAGDDDGYPL